MPYPEFFVAPMREELTSLGIQELRTPAEVDQAIANSTGTVMVVVNSVCGCAAGKARPGLALALRSGVKPDRVVSVFAEKDRRLTKTGEAKLEDNAHSVAVDPRTHLVYFPLEDVGGKPVLRIMRPAGAGRAARS